MENRYTLSCPITIGDVLCDGLLSPLAVFQKFQEATNAHTRLMGVGVDHLLRDCGVKWIVTKMKITVNRMPRLDETIGVSTWPLAPSTVKFPRCFRLSDTAGTALVDGYSEWCLLDKDTGAICRRDRISLPDMDYLTEKTPSHFLLTRPVFTAKDYRFTHTVRLSDLDINGHMNNIYYIRLALDGYSSGELSAFRLHEFDISYLRQCFEGDDIKLYRQAMDDKTDIFEGRVNEEPVFRCVVGKTIK